MAVFGLLLSGESLHNVTRYFQANNIKSFFRREKANGFSVHSARTILRSESTVRTLIASKRNDHPAIPSYYKPAIDVATFNRVQETLSKNRVGRVPASDSLITINLFEGIIRCQCGASAHPTGIKAAYRGVYRCNSVSDGHCNVPTIKRKPFDKWMLDSIIGFLERDDDNNTSKRKARIGYQISLVTSKLKKATTLLLKLDGVTELKEQVKKLNIQRSNLQSELDELNQRETSSDKPLYHLSKIDLTTKVGRVEAQLILSKLVQPIELQREMIIVTLRNGTVIGKSKGLFLVLLQDLTKQVISSPSPTNIDIFSIITSDEEPRRSGKQVIKRSQQEILHYDLTALRFHFRDTHK